MSKYRNCYLSLFDLRIIIARIADECSYKNQKRKIRIKENEKTKIVKIAWIYSDYVKGKICGTKSRWSQTCARALQEMEKDNVLEWKRNASFRVWDTVRFSQDWSTMRFSLYFLNRHHFLQGGTTGKNTILTGAKYLNPVLQFSVANKLDFSHLKNRFMYSNLPSA